MNTYQASECINNRNIIVKALKDIKYNILADDAKTQTDATILNGYVKIVEMKAGCDWSILKPLAKAGLIIPF